MLMIAVVLAIIVQACMASKFHPMEKHIPRETFVKRARADGQAMHEVVIAIRKNNMDALKNIAIDRSTPGTGEFQQWLSASEVDALVMNIDGFQRVSDWLKTNEHISTTWVSRRKDYIKAKAPIAVWESLLDAQFFRFEDLSRSSRSSDKKIASQSQIIHRAVEYSIPIELAQDISAVFHTVQVPPVFNKKYRAQDGAFKNTLRVRKADHFTTQSAGAVTVSFLNDYYEIASNIGSALQNQSVFETSDEYFSPSDLTDFQETYGTTVQSAYSIGNHDTDGTCNVGNVDCSEGNLDIQYIMGVSQVTSSIYWWVTDDDSSTDPFVAWITDVADEAYPPQANSVSWGSIEVAVSSSVKDQFDDEASILASRGVTVTVSSGDDGAPNDYQGQCLCNYTSGSGGTGWTGASWSGSGYFPSFPATSPWVTAVGATQGPSDGDPEIACQSQLGGVITSGGGFSTYYPAPSWQTSTMSYYFNNLAASGTPVPKSGYNPNGRGYPDISLIGVNYQVIINSIKVGLYGTSCSAPVMAAFVSLVNAARLESNMSTIGFLNPTLYSVGLNNTLGLGNAYNATFNDVTSGHNRCCSYSGSTYSKATCCASGFYTSPGWDPVTGWGSIFFPDFASIFDVAAPYVPSNDDDSTDALTAGEVAGVVIVVLFVVTVIGSVVYWLLSKLVAGSAMAAASQGSPPVAIAQPVYIQTSPINIQMTPGNRI